MTKIKGYGIQSYAIKTKENIYAWPRTFQITVSNPLQSVPTKIGMIKQSPAPAYFRVGATAFTVNWQVGSWAETLVETNAKWTATSDAKQAFDYELSRVEGDMNLTTRWKYIAKTSNGDSDNEWTDIIYRINYTIQGWGDQPIMITQKVKPKATVLGGTDINKKITDTPQEKSFWFYVKCSVPYRIVTTHVQSNDSPAPWVLGGTGGSIQFDEYYKEQTATGNDSRMINFRLQRNTTSDCRTVKFSIRALDNNEELGTINYIQQDAGFFNWVNGSGGITGKTRFDASTGTLYTPYNSISDSTPIKINFKCNTDWKLNLNDDTWKPPYRRERWVYPITNTVVDGTGTPSCDLYVSQDFTITLGLLENLGTYTDDKKYLSRTGHINFTRNINLVDTSISTLTIVQESNPILNIEFENGYPVSLPYSGGSTHVLVKANDYMSWGLDAIASPLQTNRIGAELTNLGDI